MHLYTDPIWSEDALVISHWANERKRQMHTPRPLIFLDSTLIFPFFLTPVPSSTACLFRRLDASACNNLPRKLNCNLPIWSIAPVGEQKREHNRVFAGSSRVVTHAVHQMPPCLRDYLERHCYRKYVDKSIEFKPTEIKPYTSHSIFGTRVTSGISGWRVHATLYIDYLDPGVHGWTEY